MPCSAAKKKKESWSTGWKSLSKHWRKSKSLNFHLTFKILLSVLWPQFHQLLIMWSWTSHSMLLTSVSLSIKWACAIPMPQISEWPMKLLFHLGFKVDTNGLGRRRPGLQRWLCHYLQRWPRPFLFNPQIAGKGKDFWAPNPATVQAMHIHCSPRLGCLYTSGHPPPAVASVLGHHLCLTSWTCTDSAASLPLTAMQLGCLVFFLDFFFLKGIPLFLLFIYLFIF